MTLVLTMAGLGSRFKNQGFTSEKYAIQFLGHSLFEWSLVSLSAFRSHPLVVVTRDFPNVRNEVLQYARNLGFEQTSVVVLDHETKGQAETALLAKPYCASAEPILNPASREPLRSGSLEHRLPWPRCQIHRFP